MTLDSVLDKISIGAPFALTPNHPSSVSIPAEADFYIKPSLTDLRSAKDSKLILFSAPGATGKSALASFIANAKNALLWDLSKERIANHSLSGMLVESLGTKLFSEFTDGLVTGKALLVIDALDEAEMISGRIALETLLSDLRAIIKDALSPTVILCARTETAHFISDFYSSDDHKLPILQYEIGFFEEANAKDFIIQKISRRHPVTSVIVSCIDAQFAQIKRILDNDADLIRSFIGYAPVLEALSVFFDEETNTIQLLQQTESATNSTEIFLKVMDRILGRERDKVVSAFKARCSADYPTFTDWDMVYTDKEQLVRIANYLIFGSTDYENYQLPLPRELASEYGQSIHSFLKDHPFIHSFEDNGIRIDFTGPAFRDYVLARLMTMSDYDDYAKEYFSEHKNAGARFPSQLFFDFYGYYASSTMKSSHFPYLYDSFKSKETVSSASSISIEQVDDTFYCLFIHEKYRRNKAPARQATEFSMPASRESICISQLNNAYIDITEDLILGTQNEDVIINNSTIKCKKLVVKTPCVMLTAYSPGETLISCSEGIDTSNCPTAKFEIRVDNPRSLKISSPDIHSWFKLHPYNYKLEDDTELDITKFENAVKTILKHFRKHGKDAPGRHREFIQNIIVGGSSLKQQILQFFLDKGIIFEDDKDLSQYKLSNERLESLGVNWGDLSRNSSPNMADVFIAYCEWAKSKG